MDVSNEISTTALITLMARAAETQRDNPIIDDPVGLELLASISENLAAETKQRILSRKVPSRRDATSRSICRTLWPPRRVGSARRLRSR